jgi:uncharacterized membrane protein HdeD (DUF308 family)
MEADTLALKWWTLVVRGVVAIAFGLLTFFRPGLSLLALVFAFGAYSLADGFMNLVLAVRRGRNGRHWGALVFGGVAGIAAGLVTFFWPGISALALLMVIAAWAIVIGVAEIAAAVRLRKVIKREWILALAGILSIAFGVLLLLFPGAGALAFVLWIGAYAMISGVLLIALGLRVRSSTRFTRGIPTRRTAVPA